MKSYEWLVTNEAGVFAVVGGGDSDTQASTSADGQASEPQSGGGGGAFGFTTILLYAGLIAALYFFMIRPQRKRDKDMKAMQSAIGVGDNVVTSSGLYGVITVVGEDCFVVEFGTNKGVRIPVRKSDILGIKTPNINPAPKETE